MILTLLNFHVLLISILLTVVFSTITPAEEVGLRPGSDPVTVTRADKIYVSNDLNLKYTFQDVVKRSFYSEVQKVDFTNGVEASQTINTWVERQTNDRIKDLLSPDDVRDAALVLVNAIYFKGAWLKPFHKSDFKEETFIATDNKAINVVMMEQTENFLYKEDADLDARIVELPYYSTDYSNEFSMLIILPNMIDGIHDLEEKLANKDINDICANATTPKVNIKLPKFKIEQTIDLQPSFEKIGLGSLFQPSHDLSDLVDTDQELVVSKAVHKAFIEVNEKGTEAAAATGIVDTSRSLETGFPEQFYVDHPFLFMLVHRFKPKFFSGRTPTHRNVLFWGRVKSDNFI